MADTGRLKIYESGVWRYVAAGEINPRLSVFMSAGGACPSTAHPCSMPAMYAQTDGSLANIYVLPYAVDATYDLSADWSFVMPINWDGGHITAKVYFTIPAGTMTDALTVTFLVSGVGLGEGDALNTAMGTAVATTHTLSSDLIKEVLVTTESGNIDLGNSAAAGDLVIIRVARDADDTFGSTVNLIGVKIFYQTNSVTE